jgi:hypothetical protein
MKYLLFLSVVLVSSPKYGREYNAERVKRGIPVIQENWKIKKSNFYSRHYSLTASDPVKSNVAHNDSKTVIVVNNMIQSESDLYIKPLDNKNCHLLYMSYDYGYESWYINFRENVDIDKDLNDESKQRYISLPQADSILTSWGLSRTAK